MNGIGAREVIAAVAAFIAEQEECGCTTCSFCVMAAKVARWQDYENFLARLRSLT